MTDTTDANTVTCPICSTSFTPLTTRAVYCSTKCSKRGVHVRAMAKAYEAGTAGITAASLEDYLRCRAAVDANVEAREEAADLAFAELQAREEMRNRRYHKAVLAAERETMRRWKAISVKARTVDPIGRAKSPTFSAPMPTDVFHFPPEFTYD